MIESRARYLWTMKIDVGRYDWLMYMYCTVHVSVQYNSFSIACTMQYYVSSSDGGVFSTPHTAHRGRPHSRKLKWGWFVKSGPRQQARNIPRTSHPDRVAFTPPVVDSRAPSAASRELPLFRTIIQGVRRLSSANMANQTPAVVMDKYVISGQLCVAQPAPRIRLDICAWNHS